MKLLGFAGPVDIVPMKLLGRYARWVYGRQPPLSDSSTRAIGMIVVLDVGAESLKVAAADCGMRAGAAAAR